MNCPAEAPFDDAVAWCRLLAGHLSRWHEATVTTRCSACGQREMHAEGCPRIGTDELADFDHVRWEGPTAPMPREDMWVRMYIERHARVLAEAPRRTDPETGRTVVVIDRSAFLFDAMLGTPELTREHLAACEEWGRELGDREVRPSRQVGA